MSGYLQRLVSSTRDSNPSLHPLLPPIFSPPKYLAQPPLASMAQELASNEARRSQTTFASRSAGELPDTSLMASIAAKTDPTGAMEKAQLAEPETPPASHSGLLRYEPLVPERTQTWPPEKVFIQPLQDATPAHASSAQITEETEDFRTATTQAVIHKPVYIPLLGERRPPLPSEQPGNQRQVPYSPATPKARNQAAAPFRTTQHDLDEIHIEIGRIEVTAVHPAPARAPLKPAAQGESLAEYLKRPARRA